MKTGEIMGYLAVESYKKTVKLWATEAVKTYKRIYKIWETSEVIELHPATLRVKLNHFR